MGKWLEKFSLRTVLIIPFVLQTVAAVGLVGYLSYKNGQQAVENLAKQVMEQVSVRIDDRLDRYLEKPQEIVSVNDIAVKEGTLNLQDLEQIRQHFWQQMILNKSTTSGATIFLREDGKFINYGRIYDQETQHLIEKVSREKMSIGSIYFAEATDDISQRKYYLIDKMGKPKKLFYTMPNNYKNLYWYKYAKTIYKPRWSPIDFYHVIPTLGIFALAPVRDSSGKFQGVFASSFTLAEVSNFLDKIKFSPSGQSFIIERNSNLIATSKLELTYLVELNKPPKRLASLNSKDVRTRDISKFLIRRFGSLNNLHKAEDFSLISKGEKVFGKVVPYQDEYGLDWLIVVAVPESDFMKDINKNTQITFLLCLATLIVTTLIGIVTARLITQPILGLNAAAKSLIEGEFTEFLSVRTVKEIGELTESFNRMQYSLNKSFQNVKKSEKKFATLLETVPIGLSVFDASGKIIVVNDAGRKLFGQEVVSAFQQTDFSEIYEVYISSTKQLYTVANFSALQAILGEVRFTNDLEIRRADGKIIPLEVRTTPVLDESGQVVYIINAFTDISEEKEAQKLIADYNRTLAAQVEEKTQALQRSEAQINTFFASAPVGMAIVDRQLRFIKINETLAEIDGVSVKDHLGKEVEEVLEVLGMEVKSLYKEVLLTGQPILNKELCGEVSSKSEFKRYWLVSYFPIFAGDNLVDGVGAIVIEITERKQLEITLEALSAKLNDILNNAAAAITSLRVFPDCQWDINHISSESETVFGYTPAEIKSNQKFWQERIFSEDWQAIEEEIFANIFAERKGTYEYRFYHKNGSLRWISQTNSSRWDCVQNCWIVTVVSLDITDQKLAEEALLESQSSLMEAEKIAHLGNWSFDLISQKIIWSEQAFRIYGIDYCQGEPSYEELLNLTHPDDRELFSRNVQLAVTEGISYEHEVRIIPADGVIRFTFGKGQAVFNKSGKIIKLFGIVQDITERKQVEAELSRAKEAAEAANKAKSSFLANMSHELRTPLNSILGFAQLMLSNSDFSKESQHFLSIINCSGEHLLRLINDVLDMAKIEAGCITINESIFSLYKLLDDLEKLFYLKIKDKKLMFNIYRDANVPESVKTDEIKLRQVLINLIGNAIKFTEVGSVTMRVSIKANYFESMPKKRRILFEIQDTGCGISEKELNKIFDPFSQTRIGKESQEGTGLGLSISRKFIELMGGEISVASKEGYGSIFKFEIDCVIGEYYSLESADKLNEANKKDDGKSEFLSVENYIINPADLQVLPASLLQALEKATVQASLQEIYMVIDEIDAINSHLGSALKSLADVFDYPEILQAVENSKLMGNNYEK